MGKTFPVIGLEEAELRWIRMLVLLLRHPDPGVPELARQALIYLTEAAGRRQEGRPDPRGHGQAGL